MFFEICMKRLVVLQPHKLHRGVLLKAAILTQLLEDIKLLKCSEDHGYYVTATTFESMGDGKVRPYTGAVVFPLEFKCIVFKPYKGEILHGQVTRLLKQGCFIFCGPLEEVFLHVQTMKGFKYQIGESMEFCSFRTDDGSAEIRVGSIVRFKILGLKWFEEQRQFKALATLDGDYLGLLPDPTEQF